MTATRAATRSPPTKTTTTATATTAGTSSVSPGPKARGHDEALPAELRQPLDAYADVGDLALEKLRDVSADWLQISAWLSDEAARLQEALAADMSRLHEGCARQTQASSTVELLRAPAVAVRTLPGLLGG